MTAVRQQLWQLLRLVEKEDLHLRGVSERFAALHQARALVQELHAAYVAISAYASARLTLDS